MNRLPHRRALRLVFCLCLSLTNARAAEKAITEAEHRAALIDCIPRVALTANWTPTVREESGFTYDQRREPRGILTEDLEKKATADPSDAATRVALSITALDEAKRQAWKGEAETIYRKRLKQNPEDAVAMAALAMLLRTVPEGYELAQAAVRRAPDCWQAHQALGLVLNDRLLRAAFAGLSHLPPSGVDRDRWDEALSVLTSSEERSKTVFQLGEESLREIEKALALAPPGEREPFFFTIALHRNVNEMTRRLHAARQEPALTDAEWNTQEAEWIRSKGLIVCKDHPESLAAAGFLAYSIDVSAAPRGLSGEELTQKQKKFLAPYLTRLQELADHADPQIAASACEGYAGVVFFVHMLGGRVGSEDLIPLLKKAVRLAPRRCLAWDLLMSQTFGSLLSNGETQDSARAAMHSLAVQRLAALPTPSSHAAVAFSSGSSKDLSEWEAAVKGDPDDIGMRLNLAASVLENVPGQAGMDRCLAELQKATEMGHQNNYWEERPGFDAYRRRIFAVHQALSGNLQAARDAVAWITERFPTDQPANELAKVLKNW